MRSDSGGGDEDVLKLMVAQLLSILKTIELYSLNA